MHLLPYFRAGYFQKQCSEGDGTLVGMSGCLSLFEPCHSCAIPLFQMTSYLCAVLLPYLLLILSYQSLLNHLLCICAACNLVEFQLWFGPKRLQPWLWWRGWCTCAAPNCPMLVLHFCAKPCPHFAASKLDTAYFRPRGLVQSYFLLTYFSFLTHYTMFIKQNKNLDKLSISLLSALYSQNIKTLGI